MFLRQLIRQFKSSKDAVYMHGQRKKWRIKRSDVIITVKFRNSFIPHIAYHILIKRVCAPGHTSSALMSRVLCITV